MINDFIYLNSKLSNTKDFRTNWVDKLTQEQSVVVASFLLSIAPSNLPKDEILDYVASNLKFASFCSVGVIPKPVTHNVEVVAKAFAHELSISENKVVASDISPSRVLIALEVYKRSLRFRKVAAIMPDIDFVKKLARETYDMVMKHKPRDVSKFIAGVIHTSFFDFAFDKNIYLTSSFYHELRQKYLPKMKESLGLNRIVYYATTELDRTIASMLTASSDCEMILGTIRKSVATIAEKDLCDKIILISELLDFPEDRIQAIANRLGELTNIEFSFSN